MRPIYDNTVIHVDITNVCHLACANCTRHVGNHRKPFFMDLATVRKAIASLEGFPGRVGIMGGEPCLHPKFREIMAIVRKMIPDRRRREFWTAGWGWKKYQGIINQTFDRDRVTYNDHTQTTGRHQPLLVAIEEVVEHPGELIEACPFQTHWSASITPKGGFFCEIAASMDWLFDGPGGYPIKPGWWDKTPKDFQDQVAEWCGKCSGALPMQTLTDNRGGRDGKSRDVVSPGNLQRLLAVGSPRAKSGHVDVVDQVDSVGDWSPRQFRDFEANTPEDVKEALNA